MAQKDKFTIAERKAKLKEAMSLEEDNVKMKQDHLIKERDIFCGYLNTCCTVYKNTVK